MFDKLYKKIVEEEEEDIFKASTPEEGLKRKKKYAEIQQKEIEDTLQRFLKNPQLKRNLDGTYDFTGNINLSSLGLEKFPVKFRNVHGSFWCSENLLTTLDGCPDKVQNTFSCSWNPLTSLEGGPSSVGAHYMVRHTEIPSFKGCADYIGGDFICEYNPITSLEGFPSTIIGEFDYTKYPDSPTFTEEDLEKFGISHRHSYKLTDASFVDKI